MNKLFAEMKFTILAWLQRLIFYFILLLERSSDKMERAVNILREEWPENDRANDIASECQINEIEWIKF